MKTPIIEFVFQYVQKNGTRFHMPGHKGCAPFGMGSDVEGDAKNDSYDAAFASILPYDITEISGADELYHADGIIRESEQNASELFGCPTFYSTEGSSLCIRAMLYLALQKANSSAGSTCPRPIVLAARNVHQTFLSACALLDLDVTWLWQGSEDASYLSLNIKAEDVSAELLRMKETAGLPICVYITTPDYLGHILDVEGIAKVCHEFGVPLLVDNAHGAYLKFLPNLKHPIDLGADMCCDSAHKTLPVLTGGAYLHVATDGLLSDTKENVKTALSMFGSTSPSWLILQSLDYANKILSEGFSENLSRACADVKKCKAKLDSLGYTLHGEEEIKITILSRNEEMTGDILAEYLRTENIEVEFSDPDMLVLMADPMGDLPAIEKLTYTLTKFAQEHDLQSATGTCTAAKAHERKTIGVIRPEKCFSIREASLMPVEKVKLKDAEGRIAAFGNTICPPAVAIVCPGEKIEAGVISCLKERGVIEVNVVKC